VCLNRVVALLRVCMYMHILTYIAHSLLLQDLSYLQAVMQSLAEQEKRKHFEENGIVQDIILHSAVCNEGKTTDGVMLGGQRLVEEMICVIKEEMETRSSSTVTVSMVGNSLGGIYSRYAIAKLAQSDELPYDLHYNIFCTTATPHLGISRHTYLPLPRSAENVVAHAMGDTGKDLYVNAVLCVHVWCIRESHLLTHALLSYSRQIPVE